MTGAVVAMTTINKESEARSLADALVAGRLAACVQIIPGMQSTYEWKGEVCRESEFLILIKTQKNLINDVKRMVEKTLSYEVPEFIVLPVIDGSEKYLSWMKAATRQ